MEYSETEQKNQSPPKAGSADVSNMISRLLEHPELISMVASAIGAKPGGTEASSPPPESDNHTAAETPKSQEAPASAPASAAAPDTGEAPANDAFAAKIPEVMATLGPVLSGLSGGKQPDDKRSCLLRALKPYVSRERAEAIDYMISVSRITDALKKKN